MKDVISRDEIIDMLMENLDLSDFIAVSFYIEDLEETNEFRKQAHKKYLEAVAEYEYEKHKNTEAIEYIKNSWNSKNTTPIENYSVGSWEIELYKILKGE